MTINFGIVVTQEDAVQAVYQRQSNGEDFNTKDSASLTEFLSDFLGLESEDLTGAKHSPFGRWIKLSHRDSRSTILMSWEYIDD